MVIKALWLCNSTISGMNVEQFTERRCQIGAEEAVDNLSAFHKTATIKE